MGLWSRLLGRRRGELGDEPADAAPSGPGRLAQPRVTPSMERIPAPSPTAGSQRLPALSPTAGTRVYRQPGGTPSIERLHNPSRPGAH